MKGPNRSVKLNERTLRALTFEGATKATVDIRWDASLPGFGVQLRPGGRKSFVVFFRAKDGRQRRMTLGTWGTNITLDQARAEARKALTAARDGRDPLDERREARRGDTVADIVKDFLKHVDAKMRPTTAKEYRRQLETHVNKRWRARRAKTIRRAEVAALHADLSKRAPTQANRTLSAISALFKWAKRAERLPEEFRNPALGIEHNEERTGFRWVAPEELPRLAAALDKEENVYVRAFFWTILFTGLRRSEARFLRWDQVDLEQAQIRLDEAHTKSKRAHVVPLAGPAKALLSALPRVSGNPHVFVGTRDGEPIGSPNYHWRRIRSAAELPDVRIHDLRRTLGSWLVSYGGANLPLVGAILNHATPSTTQLYSHLAADPRRVALEEHAARLTEVAQGVRLVKG